MYRTFVRPASSQGWSTADWVEWVRAEGLLLDVRPDIPGGVCDTCWGGTGVRSELPLLVEDSAGRKVVELRKVRWPRCYNCNEYGVLDGVLAISYSTHDRLESAIWYAKNDGPVNRWLNLPLGSLLHEFLRMHLLCMERVWGRIDFITPLPSHPETRDGWDHLKHLVDCVPRAVADRWTFTLLEKTEPVRARSHRADPIDGLFRIVPNSASLVGKRVLLVDDTFTSGSTLRSAGREIVAAGGKPPIALTIGRQVRSDNFGAHIVDDAMVRTPLFDLGRCGVHNRTTVR
ncbi:hypothetical protein GCM10009751_30980 [Myceligenerans crystallogenes]|uniref:ComF family protein n=1 Tax=Myceligenerans crystallogenes TaxID=316335 RepID=A0ABN2NIW6_9MICO